jgi:hypothetical protein
MITSGSILVNAGPAVFAAVVKQTPVGAILGGVAIVASAVVSAVYLHNRTKLNIAKLQAKKDGTNGPGWDDKFYIQSKSGHICSAELYCGSQLTATRQALNNWEFFHVMKADDGRIALKAANSWYVSADRDKGGLLIADRSRIADWELFRLEEHGEYVALKTSDGKYISRREDDNSILKANAPVALDWEMFKIMKAV